jgi:pimeloyl-ACP methyl ester carboxylesterase
MLAVPRLEVPALSVIAEDDELLKFDKPILDALQLESEVVLTQGGHRLELLPPEVVAAIAQFFAKLE